MSKKAIIITSIITVSAGSIAFYFLYWRKRGGVSDSDKAMLESATMVEENYSPLEDVPDYVESDLKPSIVQGPVKIR